LPDGQYSQLRGRGKSAQDKGHLVMYYALTNYRTWILALNYGYCFGVELTTDNIITNYFYDRFHVNLNTAGPKKLSLELFEESSLECCLKNPRLNAVPYVENCVSFEVFL
jgi:hypothetical protein